LRNWLVVTVVSASAALAAGNASAIPLFARQTGFECMQCHTNFPELTPFGRQFKLEGYTRWDPKVAPPVPIAGMTWVGVNSVANNKNADGSQATTKNGALLWEGGSIFTGGRITDNFGAFTQWTYNNLAPAADGDPNHLSGHSGIDNTDLRAVVRPLIGTTPVVLGLTANNVMTMQDVWNSTPVWGYPFKTAPLGPGFGQGTFLESQTRLAGLGAYAWIDKTWYVEGAMYKTADGAFSILTAGDGRTRIKGGAPYWRLAYNWDGDNDHIMVGHAGTIVTMDPVDANDNGGKGDVYRDLDFDAQYQHFSDDDTHIVTAQYSFIHENVAWHSGFPVFNDAPYSSMRSQKVKLTYLYQRTYGITGAVFDINGSTDTLRYGTGGFDQNGNALPGNGRPDTAGYILEAQWTPAFIKLASDPQLTVRFALQYTGYWKFNGAASNYDSSGRNASNNNSLYLYAWIML
jgi:hypothetical protein